MVNAFVRTVLAGILQQDPDLHARLLQEAMAAAPPYDDAAVAIVETSDDALLLVGFWTRMGDEIDAESIQLMSDKHWPETIPLLIELLDSDRVGHDAARVLALTGRDDGLEALPPTPSTDLRYPARVRLAEETRRHPGPVQERWRAWWETVKDRIRWDEALNRFVW